MVRIWVKLTLVRAGYGSIKEYYGEDNFGTVVRIVITI